MALYKPTSNIIGKPLDLGDGNKVIVENMVVEAPSLSHSGTIVRIEGEMVSSQDLLNTIKKYATIPDSYLDSIRFKNECFKNGIRTTGELYRNFQVTPERVIYNDPATIVFWKDGTKTVVKCMDGDTYNPEVGLAMCVCKKLYDSKYHKFFKYYTKDAPTRPLQGNVTEATEASYYNPVDEVINLIKAVFDDTKGESK